MLVDPGDVRCVAVIHHRNPGQETRIGFFFATKVWTGEPVNTEPDKCAGLLWIDSAQPPSNTITYTAAGLRAYRTGTPFGLDGWDSSPGDALDIGDREPANL